MEGHTGGFLGSLLNSHLADAFANVAESDPRNLVGVFGAVIGFFGILIAYRQSTTARARLKLDLYDKRFNIYIAVLDLHQAIMRKELRDIEEAGFIFLRAFRESLFLFKIRDGIYTTLSSINDIAVDVIAHEKHIRDVGVNGEDEREREYSNRLRKRASEGRNELESFIRRLEAQLRKYLDFRKLK